MTDDHKKLIVPLLSSSDRAAMATLSLRPEHGSAVVRLSGKAAHRIRVFLRRDGDIAYREVTSTSKIVLLADNDRELGFSAIPGPGERYFTIKIGSERFEAEVSPVLLASSLDPPERLLVVRNERSANFASKLAQLTNVPVDEIPIASISTDFWIQDAIEFGLSATPGEDGLIDQAVAPICGLRSRHDMGLDCRALDAAARAYGAGYSGATIPITVGKPLPKRRWIDWFGNLEVTPPVFGHPHGRILMGYQRELRMHPQIRAFFRDQNYQWPPLELDVSWLTIGHVDETINFVPAPGSPGFRVLLPSPALAKDLLTKEIQAGNGDLPAWVVFDGKKREITLNELEKRINNSDDTALIEKMIAKTRALISSELGINNEDFIFLPCLFDNGESVTPNLVNSLVIGNNIVFPEPGIPFFEKYTREILDKIGVKLDFIDNFDPYHINSGEVHCGTNAVRRLRNPEWWHVPSKASICV